MPEGPEVKVTVDSLRLKLVNQNLFLVQIQIPPNSKYKTKPIPGIELFQQFPMPIAITDIFCKGKQIFFNFNNQLYLNSTLGIGGRWTYNPENNICLILGFVTGDEISNVHQNQNIQPNINFIYFIDPRHFGNVTIFNHQDALCKFNKIGPDILATEVSSFEWLRIFKLKKCQNKQICQVLMNQDVISGIGNYLKAEILYYAKIKPNRIVSSIIDFELENLRQISHHLIRVSYAYGGLTIKDFWNPDGKIGTFPKIIYGQSSDPLGNFIQKDKFADGRTTHWVPNVQV